MGEPTNLQMKILDPDQSTLLWQHSFGSSIVRAFTSKQALAAFGAKEAATVLSDVLRWTEIARIIIATGNSQLEMIEAFTQDSTINWKAVEVFHMDEYVGISPDHPASFRYWLRTRVEERVSPRRLHYLNGNAFDLDAECLRYSELLNSGPIHLAFVGFGENGHIAFNDPPVADFDDPRMVKRVTLDEPCRLQQLGEGHFPDFDSVPKHALTVTCPGLFRAQNWICCVPDSRKADAVRNALEGPITTACPASLVRTHPNASVLLDADSAALLREFTSQKA